MLNDCIFRSVLRGVPEAGDSAWNVEADWTKYKQQMNELIQKDINNYNRMFKEKNMPAVITDTKEVILNN